MHVSELRRHPIETTEQFLRIFACFLSKNVELLGMLRIYLEYLEGLFHIGAYIGTVAD